MHAAQLFDPLSAVIVVGGTLVATWLRCGNADTRATLSVLGGLFRHRFDAERARSELAAQVRAIHEHGLLRAEPRRFGDPAFDEGTDALIGSRSLSALHDAHERHREQRIKTSYHATQWLAQAAELAPVFGLAGTLVSLSQLPADGAASAMTGAIAMAVLTTLYGLLLGNVVFAPLSRMVERVSVAEERERRGLVEWLALQVASEVPGARQAPPQKQAPAQAAARS